MHKAFERWREMAARVFPPSARILELPPRNNSDASVWRLLVSWRLCTEPARPSKRSKTVRIEIEAEALEDYTRSPPGARQAADTRLEAWLRAELERFDGDHDAPLGTEPPVVAWTVGTFDLNA